MPKHVVIATESLSSDRAFKPLVSKINLFLLSIIVFIIAVPPSVHLRHVHMSVKRPNR
jgi:hypothetical protein